MHVLPDPQTLFSSRFNMYRRMSNRNIAMGYIPFRLIHGALPQWFIFPMTELERFLDMAGKKPGKNRYNSSAMEFVNFRFSAKEKDDFNAWLAKGDKVTLVAVRTTVQDDNKIGVSWDATNGVYVATLMGKEGSVNEGKCLLIRSAEWERALFACAYVHEVVYSSGVWEVDKDGDLA